MGTLMLFAFAISASAGGVEYFSWQEGGGDDVICTKSDKDHGVAGNCERPGPKDLEELYCDPKFVKGSGKEGKLGPAWAEACKKYEKSGRHEIVMSRPPKYYAWQQGGADSILCKEVPKGFGTPGKCVYPGPKNLKELICTDSFFKYSGEKVNQDVFCHRHPWKPTRVADEDEGGDDSTSANAGGDGDGKPAALNPGADHDSGVSSDLD